MTPKEMRFQQQLRLANRNLSLTATKRYVGLLRAIVKTHTDIVELKELSDALRRNDFKSVYDQAGYLSRVKHCDAQKHFVCNQISLLIRKYPWESALIGTDPLRTAITSFERSNERCRKVNRKFELLEIDPSRDKFRAEGKIAMAWIRSVIGAYPNYARIFRKCDFGKGASLGIHGEATHVIRKLTNDVCTVGPGVVNHAFGGLMKNYHYMEQFMESRNGFTCLDYEKAFTAFVSRLEVIDYNKLDFVDKNAGTKRSIALEPTYSGFVQTGIGVELQGFLLRAGIDLSDQSLNQRMARDGSLDDSEEGWVTLDMRAASDSNASGPVKYYFPSGWYDLFNRARSQNYMYNGVVRPYHMLCNMGNGFCFPVETLLFASACIACGCGQAGVDFAVYGDDIIVRKKYHAKLVCYLKHIGFTVNNEKSFTEGPFRESCGADWYLGLDVRPMTLDYRLDTVQAIFKLLNLSNRNDQTRAFFKAFRETIIAALPVEFRFFRPLTGPVDSGIDTTGDEHLTSPHCRFINGIWEWKTLATRPLIDFDGIRVVRDQPWLIGIALRGGESIQYGPLIGLPSVAFRRKTRTELASDSYTATSNWLPQPFLNGR